MCDISTLDVLLVHELEKTTSSYMALCSSKLRKAKTSSEFSKLKAVRQLNIITFAATISTFKIYPTYRAIDKTGKSEYSDGGRTNSSSIMA